jgi:hypothetical protein
LTDGAQKQTTDDLPRPDGPRFCGMDGRPCEPQTLTREKIMSETKHTPGPWRVAERYHVHAIVDAKGQDLCYQDHSAYTGPGEPAGCVTSRGRSPEELRANARLIAAAPELLAALKDTLCLAEAYFDALPDDGEAQDHYMASVIEPARNAIAKAEGTTAKA